MSERRGRSPGWLAPVLSTPGGSHTMPASASWNVSPTWTPPSAALGSPAIGRCWSSTTAAVIAPTNARCWHSTRRWAAYARTLQATGSDFRHFSSLPSVGCLPFVMLLCRNATNW
uniref:Uncharacterized protein n=1 Tax=Triticum urartu TaxID=4572 RepID=A0A8R7TCA0_TRIUA